MLNVKRILIIDDDKEISELLNSKLLEDRRIKVFTAEDPFEAMEILNHQVVDAIILDWILPEMTGAETLSKTEQVFKTDPNLPYEWEDKKVKVIVLSGRERTECKASSTKHFRYSGFEPGKRQYGRNPISHGGIGGWKTGICEGRRDESIFIICWCGFFTKFRIY